MGKRYNRYDGTSYEVGSREFMMAAIRVASSPSVLFKGSSLSNGLRCIRTFERVNGIEFNPYNTKHLDAVRGKGIHEQMFGRVARSIAGMDRS